MGRGVDRTSDSAGILAGIMMGLCSLVLTYEVVMRYVFQSPTRWTYEVGIYLTVWFAFMAVAYGLKEGSHVHVDILVSRLPDNIRRVTDIWAHIIVLLYSTMFARYALQMVITSFTKGEGSEFLGLIIWPVKLAVFLGMSLTVLQTVRMLISKGYIAYKEKLLGQAKSLTILSLLIVVFLGLVVVMKFSPVVGLFSLLLFMLAFGVPISFSLGTLSAVGFFCLLGGESALVSMPIFGYTVWDNFTLIALPLFILVGNIMYRSGMSEELFAFASSWFGHLPGGLAIATLASTAVFAAITGSSLVCAATIGLVALPALARRKYSDRLAAGVVASGGTLGILIPPSAAFILYGIVAQVSIGKLFMAGIVPGIMLFILLSLTAFILCKRSGEYEPIPKASWKERAVTTKKSAVTLMMPIIILGFIYTGISTVTEAAALAVTYALAIIIIRKGFSEMAAILRESTKTVAMACVILVGAIALSKVVTMLQIPQHVINAIAGADMGAIAVVLSLMGILLILGMFLDGMACTLIVMPIAAPVLTALGVDLIWFAVLFVMNMEVAMLTPPVGINLYVIQQISGTKLESVIKGTIPFLITLLIGIGIVMAVPQIATWLPSTMMK